MSKPLIALPCTARELEDALHRVCDHEGTWNRQLGLEWDNKHQCFYAVVRSAEFSRCVEEAIKYERTKTKGEPK